MRLGSIINQYRKENGISMDDFAKMSGISKAYIGFLEKGSHPKTGKPIIPSIDMISKLAIAMSTDFDTLLHMTDEYITIKENEQNLDITSNLSTSVKIPILGRVAAGIPIDAIEDIIDYELIPENLALKGDYFGLRIKGDSMEPKIHNGDTVIVRKSDVAETGDIVIAIINDSEAVCKKYTKKGRIILLHSLNPDYEDINVTKNPDFRIIGIVVELRSRFK